MSVPENFNGCGVEMECMIEEWRNAFSLFEEISGFELDAVNG